MIALYARVSSTSQRSDLDPQLERLRAHAQSRWKNEKVEEFVDIESGTHMRRPRLQRMLELIDRGTVRIVLIVKIDRLSRSLVDGIALVDRISRSGAGLVALDQPIDTSTPAGRAGLHLLQVFAQWQRDDLRERAMNGIRAAKQRGVRFGRARHEFDLDDARQRVARSSISEVAAELGVSRSVLSRRLSESR